VIDLGRAGAVDRPDGEGRAGGGACDDRIRFTLALEAGRIAAIRFGADACPAATAAAAWLAGEAEGRSLLGAARLGSQAAHAACWIAGARLGCIEVAVDAFHAALGDAVVRGARVPGGGRLAVAMSGGVDSAVALAEAPGDAFGITLRLWIDPLAPDTERACCAPGSVRRARDLCHARGLPHVSLDLRDAFRTRIVEPFVAGYEAGETPNPCTSCNGSFRLHELVTVAGRLGADRVRTGHYARIVEIDGVPLVARGEDREKDQSYMLARVPPDVLARLEFPLGRRTKPEVRARAASLGLAAAGARESQEVCFLGGGDYRSFLHRYGSGAGDGAIEDEAGRELGRHAGVAGFTPGQRRGIGVSAAEPLYVLRTEPDRNAIVVAPLRRLGTRSVALRDVVMHRERRRVEAKLRYRSPAVAATLLGDGEERTLALERALFAVAPGQTAALYEGDAVVGCGTIARAVPDDDGLVL
jgi:tRNA-specific 2-thiouridylase